MERGMIKSVLPFAIGAVGLALLAPSFFDHAANAPAAPTASEAVAAAPAPADSAAPTNPGGRTSSGYRETAIEADAGGQYATEALVNGMPVRMMIDTGATFVAVSASTASRLGLVPGPGPKWRIKTANGESAASPVTLDAVSFGGLYMKDVQALILAPEAGEANLLGASFLKRLVSVEQRDGMLILRQ
jgi:aspartyl protease family protein